MSVMSREDVFLLVRHVGTNALSGQNTEAPSLLGTHARPEDVADASAAFVRDLAERFDKLLEQVSDNPQVQEALRVQMDTTLSAVSLQVEQLFGHRSEE